MHLPIPSLGNIPSTAPNPPPSLQKPLCKYHPTAQMPSLDTAQEQGVLRQEGVARAVLYIGSHLAVTRQAKAMAARSRLGVNPGCPSNLRSSWAAAPPLLCKHSLSRQSQPVGRDCRLPGRWLTAISEQKSSNFTGL